MSQFSVDTCIAHSGADAFEFIGYLSASKAVLFIGAVGLEQASMYCTTRFASGKNVSFKFLVENRPSVPAVLIQLGREHETYLRSKTSNTAEFISFEVISTDGATTGGRNVINKAQPWFIEKNYVDVVIDVTGMSRGVFFPLVKLACEMGQKYGFNVHVLAAANDNPSIKICSEASDRAEWMHGFQGDIEFDRNSDDLKLWVPQLTQNALNQADLMQRHIQPTPAEVCPIIPFPSRAPRQGDDLMSEYADLLFNRWEGNLLNVMYAHESDPIDVYRSIYRMHANRELVFNGAAGGKKATTVLSPAGWRLGSVGMLLAAIDLSLPVLYVETVGYNLDSPVPPSVTVADPTCLWHIWMVGHVY
ncbi:MAG: hypothetical protein HY846_05310 [Nitrosomonadales bacterium]|nr:hypothetical protein [Nitrosomonadales bacterium]